MRRTSCILFGLVWLAACSSEPCNAPAGNIYVDVPTGMASIASMDATGACAPAFGGCIPTSGTCETAACDCIFVVQVNSTTLAPNEADTCQIRVVSKSGATFATDLAFSASGGSCPAISGPVGSFVTVAFSNAGAPDGGTDGSNDGAPDGSSDGTSDSTDVAAE